MFMPGLGSACLGPYEELDRTRALLPLFGEDWGISTGYCAKPGWPLWSICVDSRLALFSLSLRRPGLACPFFFSICCL